ncbi:amidohydrolase family protein [Granulicella sp. WH15]|uniref:amidohydrolase family protein n=1 Tax=Granulicella sp. WH15 TaxID=2602070 RepID=UPI0013A56B63|nr:amidohydrolase family protein [Granulicella sp. WH15]
MKTLSSRLFAALLLAFTAIALHAQSAPSVLDVKAAKLPDSWYILHAGTLMADASKPVAKQVSVIVKNDKIDSIKPGYVDAASLGVAPPAIVQVIDLKDKFVMAGLIDAHTHIANGNLVSALRISREKILSGVTTARDAGSTPELIFPLRDAIAQSLAYGPRILASGAPISTTGGHGDFRNGNFLASLAPPAFSTGICDGEDNCRMKVREQIQLGADQIKIMATAGVADDSDTGLEQQFSDAELKVIIETAHLMKRKVMAHAIGQEGIKAAVRAGVDSIEHGIYLDDEGAKMMKEKGVYLDATLTALDDVVNLLHEGSPALSQNTKNKILRMPDEKPGVLGRQVRLAQKYGVKMAVGTDFGGTLGGEMVILVQKCGVPALDVLKADTLGNADLLSISDKVGTLEPGKSADIVAFNGSPIDDITLTTKPSFVMGMGHEYVAPGFKLP